MGWAMKLLVMCMLGLAACQQRSISGSGSGRRRQRVPAGKSEVVNFNCPEDFGYYPHPSDCTQYYVCVFGGALQESCTGGLVYSHELQTCDWPRNVVCNLSSAGSGVSTVRITDPRTQNTSPVRAATEPLTPSVGSFDVRFSDSQTSRASDAVSVFDGSNKTIRQPKILSQKSDPQQSISRFSQQPFFDTAVQESTSRPVRLTTDRTPVFPPQSSFKVGITSRPVSRPAPTLPPVEDPFYTADNWTDADYFYYYDDLLYDYYDNFPAVSTTTEAPVRQPLATSTPVREEVFESRPPPPPPSSTTSTTSTTTTSTTTTTTTTPRPRTTTTTGSPKLKPIPVRIRTGSSSFSSSSPSTTKSFSRGVATRGPASRFSSSSSPSSSLRAASSQSSSASRGSSASQSSRGGQTQLFEFSNLDLDSARAHFSSSSSSSSPSQRPSSLQSQSLRKSQQLTSSTQSRSRTKSRSRGRAHPSRVQANPPRSSQPQSPPILSASQALRISPGFPQTKESSPKSNPSASSSSFPPFRSPSSSSSSSSSASSTSSSSSRAPSLSQSSSRQPTRTSSSSSNRGSQRASSASSGPVTVDSSVPKRPNPTRSQPPVDTKATRCDPKICRLPDCYCGGKEVPGGYAPESIPQLVLLTFDDAVNDLNKGLYRDLFEVGRANPNGCPIVSTMYVSHEWTDYTQVQDLYANGHEIASHSVSHSFGEQFSIKKWAKEIAGQREILAAYGGVKMEDVRGMRAPFLAVGGNKMFKMLYDQNFTYDSSMPVYENKPPSWPYTLDYKIFHDCMIPPCPTNSYPGVWEVPMVMWQDLNGGRCSMGDACTTPPDAEGVYKMLIKNFERHYTSNRAPFGLFYHAAWFTTPHHKEGFIAFLDTITAMDDVWLITNHQLLQWMRDPQPLSTVKNFPAFGCNFPDRKKCTSTKVCNVWHKGGVRYMRTCQQCPEKYPWTGNTGIRSPLNDI